MAMEDSKIPRGQEGNTMTATMMVPPKTVSATAHMVRMVAGTDLQSARTMGYLTARAFLDDWTWPTPEGDAIRVEDGTRNWAEEAVFRYEHPVSGEVLGFAVVDYR